MTKYNAVSDYEREETRKYEGVYTPEEIELNRRLKEACFKEEIDFTEVEELLERGADPLGGTKSYGWELLEHIYGDLVCNEGIDLPKITMLFLRYGMDIDNPRIPYDGENSVNPLWDFAFAADENTTLALKMLLDKGLSADSFGEFWDHAMIDFFHCSCGDPQNDEFWNSACVWTFKMLLLGASYEHIIDNDDVLREFICLESNSYDVRRFRKWDDYEYSFDTSYCEGYPQLYGSIIHIFERENGCEVWKIGVGAAGRKAMAISNGNI